MTMAPTLPRPLGRSLAMLDAVQDSLTRQDRVQPQTSLLTPIDARDLVADSEVATANGNGPARPAVASIDDQRERAQREFKQIWNLCALTH